MSTSEPRLDIRGGTLLRCALPPDVTSFTPPPNVRAIGSHAFRPSPQLRHIVLPPTVETLYPFAFFRVTALEQVDLSEGLRIIRSNAFAGCASLKKLHLPSTVQTLSPTSLNGLAALETLTVGEGSPFVFEDGMLLSRDRCTLLWLLPRITSLTVPETVVQIEKGALMQGALCGEGAAFSLDALWRHDVELDVAALRDVVLTPKVRAVAANAVLPGTRVTCRLPEGPLTWIEPSLLQRTHTQQVLQVLAMPDAAVRGHLFAKMEDVLLRSAAALGCVRQGAADPAFGDWLSDHAPAYGRHLMAAGLYDMLRALLETARVGPAAAYLLWKDAAARQDVPAVSMLMDYRQRMGYLDAETETRRL